MRLAELVYEIVRESIEIPSSMGIEGFVAGTYDDDRDFSSQISFAFNYVNLALSRLFTEKKTKPKIASVHPNASGYAEFPYGEIMAVVDKPTPDYERVLYSPFQDGIAIERKYVSYDEETESYEPVFVEYRPFIPHFSMSSIRAYTSDEAGDPTYGEVKIELSQYGVTDEMCAYVKEYCKGGLLEYMSPDLSARHVQMAESYFSALETQRTKFPQKRVRDAFGGDW